MSADPWPIRRLLDWTEKFFREKGVESPRLDAQIFLAHILNCKRIDLYVRSEELTAEPQRAAFRALIKKRVDGCPVAYLAGQREFYQLSFDVTPAVLIPRPETEFLVVECLRLIKGKGSARVVDVGTGSGCIAVSVAHQQKSANVTAIDISPDALAVARRNAAKHGIESIRFLQGDLLAPAPGEIFDVLVSNPPYVSADELAGLAKEVRDFEPKLALDGGVDGLAVYRRLIAEVPGHLETGGHLVLEIGAAQDAAVRELIGAAGCFEGVVTRFDGQKLPRVVVARKR